MSLRDFSLDAPVDDNYSLSHIDTLRDRFPMGFVPDFNPDE